MATGFVIGNIAEDAMDRQAEHVWWSDARFINIYSLRTFKLNEANIMSNPNQHVEDFTDTNFLAEEIQKEDVAIGEPASNKRQKF